VKLAVILARGRPRLTAYQSTVCPASLLAPVPLTSYQPRYSTSSPVSTEMGDH